MALAVAHGTFIETGSDRIEFRVNPGAKTFRITMMSRKGLLPEADFYHPVPYEPLQICTQEAIEHLIEEDCDRLVERSYDLFKAELERVDPDYAAKVGLADLVLEDFADRYFAERVAADTFDWAQLNLAEARGNYERKFTVPWRYAILRMHEVLALIVPHLDEEALERFNRDLKPIFVDEYATVPHLSIERLLALHRVGHLQVTALGAKHLIDTRGKESGALVTIGGKQQHYPAFIDATGQRPLAADAFPFLSLLKQGVVRDTADDDAAGTKGIAVDENFHPVTDQPMGQQLYCLSIPFILERHPFIQGITSSHEMGQIVGAALANSFNAEDPDLKTSTGAALAPV